MTGEIEKTTHCWPKCQTCEGKGTNWFETCIGCGGTGRDPNCCDLCEERAVGFNDDGEPLCEDCILTAIEEPPT